MYAVVLDLGLGVSGLSAFQNSEARQLRDSIKFNFGHMTSLFIKRPGLKASKDTMSRNSWRPTQPTALPTLTCGRNRNLVPYIQITCVTRSRSQGPFPLPRGPGPEWKTTFEQFH